MANGSESPPGVFANPGVAAAKAIYSISPANALALVDEVIE
jgi:hypothetical protein